MEIRKHLDLLGFRVRDRVTGMEGVVTSMAFDLYGCVQAIIHPGIDKDSKLRDLTWFDVARLEIISKKPVMTVPNFDSGPVAEGKKGPAEKPSHMKA